MYVTMMAHGQEYADGERDILCLLIMIYRLLYRRMNRMRN